MIYFHDINMSKQRTNMVEHDICMLYHKARAICHSTYAKTCLLVLPWSKIMRWKCTHIPQADRQMILFHDINMSKHRNYIVEHNICMLYHDTNTKYDPMNTNQYKIHFVKSANWVTNQNHQIPKSFIVKWFLSFQTAFQTIFENCLVVIYHRYAPNRVEWISAKFHTKNCQNHSCLIGAICDQFFAVSGPNTLYRRYVTIHIDVKHVRWLCWRQMQHVPKNSKSQLADLECV